MTSIDIPMLIESLRNKHIGFPRDTELRSVMNLAFERMWIRKDPAQPHGRKNRHEQIPIVVSGSTGAGKSHSCRMLLASLGRELVDPDGNPGRVVSVTMPSPFSAKELARRILRELDVKFSDDLTEVELWEVIVSNFAGHRVVLLHIDEFQRYTTIKSVGRSEAAKSIERLSATLNELLMADEWPVCLMISGTEEVLPFWRMKLVDQVHRRTKFVLFEPITPRYYSALRTALNAYCDIAGVSNGVLDDDLPGRIAMAAENTLGIALELMQEAVVRVVREGQSTLKIEDLAKTYAVRTGVGRDHNPFFAKDWAKIGVREKAAFEDYTVGRKERGL
jgi:hypothetical protein